MKQSVISILRIIDISFKYLQRHTAPKVNFFCPSRKPEICILGEAIKKVNVGSQTSKHASGRPDPISVITMSSQCLNNAPVSRYPHEFDALADLFLAVQKKSSRVVSESVATPGSKHPQITASGAESRQKIDRKKDKPPEEEKNIG